MNANDHSVLIFLLDALEVSPAKASELLAIVSKRTQASEDFKAEVQKLNIIAEDEVAILLASKELRERLR